MNDFHRHLNKQLAQRLAKRAVVVWYDPTARDIIEHVDPVFYGDPKAAAFKALGMN